VKTNSSALVDIFLSTAEARVASPFFSGKACG